MLWNTGVPDMQLSKAEMDNCELRYYFINSHNLSHISFFVDAKRYRDLPRNEITHIFLHDSLLSKDCYALYYLCTSESLILIFFGGCVPPIDSQMV